MVDSALQSPECPLEVNIEADHLKVENELPYHAI